MECTHLLRRALRGHLAVGQHDHLVRDAECFLQVVRHHDAGDAQRVVQLADQLGRGTQGNRVQPRERLVVHDQVRVQRDGAGQRHAAGHAAGDLAGHQVARAAQPDGIELHQDDVANQASRAGRVCSRNGKRDVVEHAQVGEQGTELEQHAHAPAHRVQACLVERADLLAVEQQFALLGAHLAADQPQHRRLAAAGSAHERGDLAARHGKLRSSRTRPLPVAEAQVAAFDERRGVGIGHPAWRGRDDGPAVACRERTERLCIPGLCISRQRQPSVSTAQSLAARDGASADGQCGCQRGRSLNPIRNSSTARAACRPSRIAHTTSDWPRRMSPAANTLGRWSRSRR